MRKLTFMMAVVFSLAAANSFAGDKDKGKAKEKCTPGKECCKKMTKASAAEKAKCAKMCAKADAKKA